MFLFLNAVFFTLTGIKRNKSKILYFAIGYVLQFYYVKKMAFKKEMFQIKKMSNVFINFFI